MIKISTILPTDQVGTKLVRNQSLVAKMLAQRATNSMVRPSTVTTAIKLTWCVMEPAISENKAVLSNLIVEH